MRGRKSSFSFPASLAAAIMVFAATGHLAAFQSWEKLLGSLFHHFFVKNQFVSLGGVEYAKSTSPLAWYRARSTSANTGPFSPSISTMP